MRGGTVRRVREWLGPLPDWLPALVLLLLGAVLPALVSSEYVLLGASMIVTMLLGVSFNLLFGYALQQPGVLQYWLVTHHSGGSRVRPVTINRQAASPRQVDWEIETAILNA